MKLFCCCSVLKIACCPPCPRSIIQNIAFQPPPPSYSVRYDEQTTRYSFRLDQPLYLKSLVRLVSLQDVEVTVVRTSCGTKIVCMYYALSPPSQTTILYSHGNGSDLGGVIAVCAWIARSVRCNILAYDYSGYGRSTGKPSEKRMYADITAAFRLLQERYRCDPGDVVLMGQSLGTVPTIDLASRVHVKGVIVQSGLATALNVVVPQDDMRDNMCCDMFKNIDKISSVSAPVLVVHGTADDMVDLRNGLALHARCPQAVPPLWLSGAGHNDLELHAEYWHRINRFINSELNGAKHRDH